MLMTIVDGPLVHLYGFNIGFKTSAHTTNMLMTMVDGPLVHV